MTFGNCSHTAPRFLGTLTELEHHVEHAIPRQRALRPDGTMSNRPKGRFNRIHRAQTRSLLSIQAPVLPDVIFLPPDLLEPSHRTGRQPRGLRAHSRVECHLHLPRRTAFQNTARGLPVPDWPS